MTSKYWRLAKLVSGKQASLAKILKIRALTNILRFSALHFIAKEQKKLIKTKVYFSLKNCIGKVNEILKEVCSKDLYTYDEVQAAVDTVFNCSQQLPIEDFNINAWISFSMSQVQNFETYLGSNLYPTKTDGVFPKNKLTKQISLRK